MQIEEKRDSCYLTRSAKLRECRCFAAKLATSSSAIVVELGGCDHLCVDGELVQSREDMDNARRDVSLWTQLLHI